MLYSQPQGSIAESCPVIGCRASQQGCPSTTTLWGRLVNSQQYMVSDFKEEVFLRNSFKLKHPQILQPIVPLFHYDIDGQIDISLRDDTYNVEKEVCGRLGMWTLWSHNQYLGGWFIQFMNRIFSFLLLWSLRNRVCNPVYHAGGGRGVGKVPEERCPSEEGPQHVSVSTTAVPSSNLLSSSF